MATIIGILLFFASGLCIGVFVAFRLKTKAIKTLLRRAVVVSPVPDFSSDSDEMQHFRADTIEKKILYEEELALLFRMGQEMFSNVSMENIAKVIVENVSNLTNAEICVLLLEDKETQDLVPIYSIGVKKEFLDKKRFKRGESISGWVASQKEILVKHDIESDQWFQKQNRGEYFVHSLVSIPLLSKDRSIGVLNLSDKRLKQRFTDEEIAFLRGMATQASLALQNANLYEQVQESYLRTITTLAFALDARDSFTRQHSEKVTKYAVAIAQELGLQPQEVDCIRRAGLLHDIGKIGIRDGVLLKPTRLSEEEYNDIKNHPPKGESIVSALPFLKEEAKIIRHHHERYDGKGYPDGVAGEEIEYGARILAVADSFDAMVENRIYRKALSLSEAFAELRRNSGTQFDPAIANALIRVLEKNPGFLHREPAIQKPACL